MNNTLKTLKYLITKEFEEMSLEELAVVYQRDNNPSAYATAFSRVYKLAKHISRKYYGLSQEDIASFALEVLHNCLYNYDKQQGAAFSSYFVLVFASRLRTETESLNTHKRKVLFNSHSLEDLTELTGFDVADPRTLDSSLDMLITLSQSTILSDMEREYCKLLMEGYANSDIASILSVSIMTLCNMRKRLRVKLMPVSL